MFFKCLISRKTLLLIYGSMEVYVRMWPGCAEIAWNFRFSEMAGLSGSREMSCLDVARKGVLQASLAGWLAVAEGAKVTRFSK